MAANRMSKDEFFRKMAPVDEAEAQEGVVDGLLAGDG